MGRWESLRFPICDEKGKITVHARRALEVLAGKKSRCKDCGEVFPIPVPTKRASEAARTPAGLGAGPVTHSVGDVTRGRTGLAKGEPRTRGLGVRRAGFAAATAGGFSTPSQDLHGRRDPAGFTDGGFMIAASMCWSSSLSPLGSGSG